MVPLCGRGAGRRPLAIPPLRGKGEEAPAPQRLASGVTIVALVQAEPVGPPPPVAKTNTGKRCQPWPLVRAGGFAQAAGHRVALGSHDAVAVAAAKPGFARIADPGFGPLFDLTTRAS